MVTQYQQLQMSIFRGKIATTENTLYNFWQTGWEIIFQEKLYVFQTIWKRILGCFLLKFKKKKKVVLECKLLCKCLGRTLQRPRPTADTSDKIHTSTRPALQNHWVPSTHGGFSQVSWSQMPWRAQKYRCKHSFEVTERNSSCVSLTTDLAPFATRITAVKTFISNLQFL